MLTVTPAVEDDLPELIDLLDEMDRFYGDVTAGTTAERRAGARVALFGRPTGITVLLARADRRIVGMAAYSYLWPAEGVRTSLYLKELYVRDGSRGVGVGRRLMDELVGIARRDGCSRVEWTADRDNEAAQRFYATLGHRVNERKIMYRVTV